MEAEECIELEQQLQRQHTTEESIEGIAARHFIKEYLEKTAKELPPPLKEETARKKEHAARKRAKS